VAGTAIPLEELFDAEFLDSITRLRIVAGRVPRGGRFAEQRSRDLGHGIEFRDYRPYAPGDDLRGVDWNIYRRLGRVFLRLFEEFEDLPLYLMPDVSRSMFLEQPPRARAGLRCALALAAISLGQHDSVGIFPFAEDLRVLVRPQAGKQRVLTFAKHLAGIEPGGTTDLARSIARLSAMNLRQGLLVVVSDFFDPAGIDAVLEALRRTRHRLLLVQLVRASDRDPALEGDLRLRDCVSGTSEDVSVTAAVLERYRAAHERFEHGLVGFARSRGAGFLRLDVEAEVVPQLAALFESGRYAV
jgi:uncharacterized protein (DUF58 family)